MELSSSFDANTCYKVTYNLIENNDILVGRTIGISYDLNVVKKAANAASKYKYIYTIDKPIVSIVNNPVINNIIYTHWANNYIHIESTL